MEPRAGLETQRPEIQAKDHLRATQREKILKDNIKSTSARERMQELIPSDRLRPNTAVQEAHLREFAEYLKKDTHTVLFGLAATSNNPMEMQNIFFNIANLKKVNSLYWKFEESEEHFLRRKLPENINVSEEAKYQADPTLADDLPGLLLSRLRPGTNAMRNDPRYALESFLYTISAENVPLEEKRRVLSDFYSAKSLMSAPSGNEDRQKIYGSDSSFWNHVDGSWIYPKLSPVPVPKGTGRVEQSKKTASGVVGDMKSRLKRPEATPQDSALSAVGQRQPDGHIYGLYSNATVTLQDGKEYKVGNYPHFLGGTVSLEDGNKVPSDQIISFRNPDSKIDIPVWNTPAPKPRNR